MASVVAALLIAVACHGSVDPVFPRDAIPFEPLAPYRTWWSLVESCSGLTGDFTAVHWYTSSGVTEEGRKYSVAWITNGKRIVIAEGRQTDGGTVRHEMLHALVRESAHPHEYFVLCCGALTFGGTCRLTQTAISTQQSATG